MGVCCLQITKTFKIGFVSQKISIAPTQKGYSQGTCVFIIFIKKYRVENMALQAKKIKLSGINNILPPEIVEKILKLITYNDIYQAKLTCRKWNEIIHKGSLMKRAFSKIFYPFVLLYILFSIIFKF